MNEKVMSKANVLRILENNQRRSFVHVDIEIPPEKDQNKDTAIEASIEDVNKSPIGHGIGGAYFNSIIELVSIHNIHQNKGKYT